MKRRFKIKKQFLLNENLKVIVRLVCSAKLSLKTKKKNVYKIKYVSYKCICKSKKLTQT